MVKKINVYPIQCQLISNQTINATILKLTSTGALVNTHDVTLRVNSAHKISFSLPATGTSGGAFIDSEALVFKTYDEFKGKHGLVNPGSHVNELVFKNMNKDMREALVQFLSYIKVHSIS